MIDKLLLDLTLGKDEIYSYDFNNNEQAEEIKLRKAVANSSYQDYFKIISHSHSIPVMDKEIKRFCDRIPSNGIVVDVGGCWGWHWRNLKINRPDISVLIVDLVRENFIHAKTILGDQINKNIFLIHGDATSLKLPNNSIDGWWSVQTLQHIPNYEKAVNEAYRIIKKNGFFANYSLNNQSFIKIIYKILRKKYHIHGIIPGSYYLSRASNYQYKIIEKIFSNKVETRYTEVIYSPELKFYYPGRLGSIIGKLDNVLSSGYSFFSPIARQKSFHTFKIN